MRISFGHYGIDTYDMSLSGPGIGTYDEADVPEGVPMKDTHPVAQLLWTAETAYQAGRLAMAAELAPFVPEFITLQHDFYD